TGTVRDRGLGGGLIQPIGMFHTLSLFGTAHYLNNWPVTYTASGLLNSKWTDTVQTEIEGGRALTDTASALIAGIYDRYARIRGTWTEIAGSPWDASLKGRSSFFTDENNLLSGELQ